MPHANRPSGPGTPKTEQRDAVVQQEGLDELQVRDDPDATTPLPDPVTSARHAERAAHTKKDGENKKR